MTETNVLTCFWLGPYIPSTNMEETESIIVNAASHQGASQIHNHKSFFLTT